MGFRLECRAGVWVKLWGDGRVKAATREETLMWQALQDITEFAVSDSMEPMNRTFILGAIRKYIAVPADYYVDGHHLDMEERSDETKSINGASVRRPGL